MSTPVKIAGFLGLLGVVFAATLGIGRAVGPWQTDEPDDAESAHSAHAAGPAATAMPGGLQVAEGGYALDLAQTAFTAGHARPIAFRVLGPDGEPVTAYDVEHEKSLHLIAVRRDFTGFQHVHPELTDDGTWRTSLDLAPGAWRLFADFTPSGAGALTLGTDLLVPGQTTLAPPPGEQRTALVDGYALTLSGDLAAGRDAELTLKVSKNGQPVTDLQPYLGAYGHLVALREGDLAYLHVHPEGHPGDGVTASGPEIVFRAAVPSAGGYRLFLDFQHGGVVRTAEFAVATDSPTPAPPVTSAPSEEGAHDHGH